MIFIDYLETGDLLDRLNDEIMKNRPHLQMQKKLFHYANAPAHRPVKAPVLKNKIIFAKIYFIHFYSGYLSTLCSTGYR